MSEIIKYFKHHEIDQIKWDECIKNSFNQLIYVESWCLNSMCNNQWDALILGDYKAVMPLPFLKKLWFKFLFQPYFLQQLGVFSTIQITDELIESFISKIPSSFRHWYTHLNHQNVYFSPKYTFQLRTNYVLNLNKDYLTIYDKYNADAKKNIAKLAQKDYQTKNLNDVELVLNTFFDTYSEFYKKERKETEKRARVLLNEAIRNNKGLCKAIYNKDNVLWSIGFFLKSKNRLYYIMGAPTKEGKKNSATHALIDEVIKEFSNQDYILDFEGSNIESVAFFYSKFGSEIENFISLTNNQLPWWCKWMK